MPGHVQVEATRAIGPGEASVPDPDSRQAARKRIVLVQHSTENRVEHIAKQSDQNPFGATLASESTLIPINSCLAFGATWSIPILGPFRALL